MSYRSEPKCIFRYSVRCETFYFHGDLATIGYAVMQLAVEPSCEV